MCESAAEEGRVGQEANMRAQIARIGCTSDGGDLMNHRMGWGWPLSL